MDVEGGDAFFIALDNRKTHGDAPFKFFFQHKKTRRRDTGLRSLGAEENLPGSGLFAFLILF